MADPMKIRATLQGDTVEVRVPPRVRLDVASIGTTNPGAQWEDNEIRTSI